MNVMLESIMAPVWMIPYVLTQIDPIRVLGNSLFHYSEVILLKAQHMK